MKYVIKLALITIFVSVIFFQVLGLAQRPGFNYDFYLKCAQKIEDVLDSYEIAEYTEIKPDILYTDAKLALLKEDVHSLKANAVFKQMIKEYEKLKTDPEQRQKALEEIANLTYKSGNYKKALIKAQEVLAEYPHSLAGSNVLAMCYHRKASAYVKQRKYDSAIAEYEHIFEYPVSANLNAFANYCLGLKYEQKGDQKTALIYYNNVINECPELSWAQYAQEKVNTAK
ncbi:MAG: hypothetical protein DRP78_05215 [Candidatus Omnitrophota bacterium]|nr:MAG: hypothetical protein DRP78_05215 [Candidatus Omnitrophota bacterium]